MIRDAMAERLAAVEAENAALWRLVVVEVPRGGRWWAPASDKKTAPLAIQALKEQGAFRTFEGAQVAIREALGLAPPRPAPVGGDTPTRPA